MNIKKYKKYYIKSVCGKIFCMAWSSLNNKICENPIFDKSPDGTVFFEIEFTEENAIKKLEEELDLLI